MLAQQETISKQCQRSIKQGTVQFKKQNGSKKEKNRAGPTRISPIETRLHFPFGVNGLCKTFFNRIAVMITHTHYGQLRCLNPNEKPKIRILGLENI